MIRCQQEGYIKPLNCGVRCDVVCTWPKKLHWMVSCILYVVSRELCNITIYLVCIFRHHHQQAFYYPVCHCVLVYNIPSKSLKYKRQAPARGQTRRLEDFRPFSSQLARPGKPQTKDFRLYLALILMSHSSEDKRKDVLWNLTIRATKKSACKCHPYMNSRWSLHLSLQT